MEGSSCGTGGRGLPGDTFGPGLPAQGGPGLRRTYCRGFNNSQNSTYHKGWNMDAGIP